MKSESIFKERKDHHHHHLTQCIPLIEKRWTWSRKGKMAATHTYKGERD